MRSVKLVSVFLSLLVLLSVSAHAGVSVNFVHPEKFRDEDFRRSFKRDGVIAELRKYFDRLGAIYLKKGQTLQIDVLNADLAGRYEPWNGLYDVRVLRDVTPPSFRLRYTLRQGKKIVARGEETVTDMNYLWNLSARSSSGRFTYEKAMLRDWFRKRFAR
jgi:hypothetical protein